MISKEYIKIWLYYLLNNPLFLIKKIFSYSTWGVLTYSQLWEDLIINRIFSHKKDWFYIDVWANDNIRLNNTYLFYQNWWNGINIEPNISLYNKINKKRKRDINLNIGIWNNTWEKLKLYIPRGGIWHVLATFDEKIKKDYERQWISIFDTQEIEIMKLKDVFEKYTKWKQVDFLSIDTEWFEMEVLNSNDWNIYRPHLIMVEAQEYWREELWKKLDNIFDPYFKEIGYTKIADTLLNSIYASKEFLLDKNY